MSHWQVETNQLTKALAAKLTKPKSKAQGTSKQQAREELVLLQTKLLLLGKHPNQQPLPRCRPAEQLSEQQSSALARLSLWAV